MTDRDDGTGRREATDVGAKNEVSGAIIGPNVQAGSIHGGVNFTLPQPRSTVVPAQLPSCSPYFTNREREFAILGELAEESERADQRMVVVITGQGGVGKTSLGLCWLNSISGGYGDGQLYLDLQGFSGSAPLSPAEALPSFLRALGVAPEEVPLSAEDQSALFRSLTAGRRLIVVLDNAVSAAQVRPLLPGNGPTVVLVTTRLQLSGLIVDGASFLGLEPLDVDGARRLLARMVGTDRTAAEPAQVRLLAELCGRLPLALCTSAARLAVRGRWTIARVVDELTDERRRLTALHVDEDLSVRAVFDTSYGALPPAAARLYRLLGLHPGPDFDVSLASAVARDDGEGAVEALETLVSANLLQEEVTGRFRFHDLLRLHARSIAEQTEFTDEHQAALRRIVDHYLTEAAAAEMCMIPGRWRLGSHYEAAERESRLDKSSALAWLESELVNLTAVLKLAYEHELYRQAWEICEAMWALFVYRKHYRAWLDTHQIGLKAARACKDELAEARILEQLGSAYLNLKDFPAAEAHAASAIRIEHANDHTVGEATALEVRGVAELGMGRPHDAIETFTRSLELNRRAGMRRAVAIMNRQLGDALGAVGRVNESIEHLVRAREYFATDNDPYNEVRTLSSLARVHTGEEQITEAENVLRTALHLSRLIGATNETAGVHLMMARLARLRGDSRDERLHLQTALDIYEAQGAPTAQEVRDLLADVSSDER